MPDELPGHVADFLRRHRLAEGRLVLGFSGGLDSTVLLDVLARLSLNFTALHVNHGLSPHAGEWEVFCSDLAGRYGVPFAAHHVNAHAAPGESPEAAARAARYRVYEGAACDTLLLAHHQDDQAETLLLQLLRGSGPKGIAAMPEIRPLGNAKRLARPLLEVPRHRLLDYARQRNLQWIEDESNRDTRFSRNFLRQEVLPLLERHYPAYRQSLSRAARHAGEAALLLDDLAQLDAVSAIQGGYLEVEALRRLDAPRGRNLLRYFLTQHGIEHPPFEQLEEMRRQLLEAVPDARLEFDLGGKRLFRYRGRVEVVGNAAPFLGEHAVCWMGEEAVSLAGGRLFFEPCLGDGVRKAVLWGSALTLKPRYGGESLRVRQGGPRRTLKHLYQEHGIPPWRRLSMPLLWQGGQLLWVPDIGVNADFMANAGEEGVRLRWVSD